MHPIELNINSRADSDGDGISGIVHAALDDNTLGLHFDFGAVPFRAGEISAGFFVTAVGEIEADPELGAFPGEQTGFDADAEGVLVRAD
jgi:hypothetical protein